MRAKALYDYQAGQLVLLGRSTAFYHPFRLFLKAFVPTCRGAGRGAAGRGLSAWQRAVEVTVFLRRLLLALLTW